MAAGEDVLRVQPGAGGDRGDWQLDAERERLGRGDGRTRHQPSGIARDPDLDEPGHLLEQQDAVAIAAMAGEDTGRADIGMAGERHLGGAVKNADARRVGRIARRQHEGRLAIVHLRRQRLHLGI